MSPHGERDPPSIVIDRPEPSRGRSRLASFEAWLKRVLLRPRRAATRIAAPENKSRLRNALAGLFRSTILVRVTNLGLGFVLTTLVVAVGATNTGNNGLYLLLALFFAVLVVSGVLSRQNVENLTVRLEGPDEIFASSPARFLLRIANNGVFTRKALLVKISSASPPLLFPEVPSKDDAARPVDLIFSRRGRRTVDSLLVYSGYPIGLFRKGRVHRLDAERIVYPAVRVDPTPVPPPRDEGQGPSTDRRGRGLDIRHLREAGAEDGLRDVHWPQTARQGRLIVKERTLDRGRDALIAFDIAKPERADAGWNARFEEAVSEAAALAVRLVGKGDRVGLAMGKHRILPDTGLSQRRRLLTALALVEPEAVAAPPFVAPPGAVVYNVRVKAMSEAPNPMREDVSERAPAA